MAGIHLRLGGFHAMNPLNANGGVKMRFDEEEDEPTEEDEEEEGEEEGEEE